MPDIEDINATVQEPEVLTWVCPEKCNTTIVDDKCQICGAVLIAVYA